MSQDQPFKIIGVEASPYSVKLRAVCRYRRIPHIWQSRMPQMFEETAHLRPSLMPVMVYPNGEYHTDSTPIIYDLERRFPASRSVIPDAPGLAFLSHLIEDMADEWVTKALFYYRFHTHADGSYAASWVQDDALAGLSRAEHAAASAAFQTRQLERIALVGSVEAHAPLFEHTYAQILQALEATVANERFLFGTRPALADFGLIGQLNTLGNDLTSAAIMRAQAPRTENWVRRGLDLSGVEGEWYPHETPYGAGVESLLRLACDMYLPFLRANASACEEQRTEVEVDILGTAFRQAPFRYQAKCLQWLRAEFNALDAGERERIAPIMIETGCWAWFENSSLK